MLKVIITGAAGQLGSCILRKYATDEEVKWVGFSREEFDINDTFLVREILDKEKPDAVVNAAAYTAVDRAEKDKSWAKTTNCYGVRNLAEACESKGVKLIHISTDYVFSGEDGGTLENPYKPSDLVNPMTVYGRTKYQGERAVLGCMSRTTHYIVRTGWIYDYEGRNFFNTMRGLASGNDGVIKIVDNQNGTPTWAGSLAEALRGLVLSDLDSGIYHYSDKGVVSWFGFASEIFFQLGLSPNHIPISSDEYPTEAKRPANSHLGGEDFAQALGIAQKHWKESLEECISEMKLWEEVLAKAAVWTKEPFDSKTRAQVQKWIDSGDRINLIESFHKDMEFGTGGMRGKFGPGTNRINRATIAQATQGLCNYLKAIKEELPSPLKVVIAYDSRLQSPDLARVTAEVLAGNSIEALIYPQLRPTPQLSFTVPHLDCAAGVVITASHNPPEYNGYKVYFKDGAQITAPHDAAIISEVRKVKSLNEVLFDGDMITELGPELDSAYREKVKGLRRSRSLAEEGSDVKLVYTGLHGTGAVSVPVLLKEFGFKHIYEVESQAVPDGNFPTVKIPNPEEPEALGMAISLAEEVGADLVMGTDPDADRVGLAVPGRDGNMVLLNGNETGALLCDYVLRNGRVNGSQYDSTDFIASTIVTTPLLIDLAIAYGVGHRETLTGFKYIGAAISEEERNYVVGGEESYGYLIGDTARDKDGVAACCVLSELAHELKQKGETMLGRLEEIHKKFGVYEEGLVSVFKEGRAGEAQIQTMMANYRSNAPREILGEEVVKVRDFSDGSQTNFPKSNVLQFITEKGSRITVRPSGTEPKIKFYVSVVHQLRSDEDYIKVRSELKKKVADLFAEFGA